MTTFLDQQLIESSAAEVATKQTHDGALTRAGIDPAVGALKPGAMQRLHAYERDRINRRFRELRKEQARQQPLRGSDHATLRHIAWIEHMIDCILANAVAEKSLDNLTNVNDKGTVGKGTGGIVTDYVMQLVRTHKELCSSMLMTPASRHNQMRDSRQQDAVAFLAEARRRLLDKRKPPAITVDVKAEA